MCWAYLFLFFVVEVVSVSNITKFKKQAPTRTAFNFVWPDPTAIPYSIDNGFNAADTTAIEEILTFYQDNTCLNFVTSTTTERMTFVPGTGCLSDVGTTPSQGATTINIDTTQCFVEHGILVHEVGHALGLGHMQSRSDRNDYIFVDNTNVAAASEYEILQPGNNVAFMTRVGPYDYKSTMHYSINTFAQNSNLPVSYAPVGLGNSYGLSPGDLALLKFVYTQDPNSDTCLTRQPQCLVSPDARQAVGVGETITSFWYFNERHSTFVRPAVAVSWTVTSGGTVIPDGQNGVSFTVQQFGATSTTSLAVTNGGASVSQQFINNINESPIMEFILTFTPTQAMSDTDVVISVTFTSDETSLSTTCTDAVRVIPISYPALNCFGETEDSNAACSGTDGTCVAPDACKCITGRFGERCQFTTEAQAETVFFDSLSGATTTAPAVSNGVVTFEEDFTIAVGNGFREFIINNVRSELSVTITAGVTSQIKLQFADSTGTSISDRSIQLQVTGSGARSFPDLEATFNWGAVQSSSGRIRLTCTDCTLPTSTGAIAVGSENPSIGTAANAHHAIVLEGRLVCKDGWFGSTCQTQCPGGEGTSQCFGHGLCNDGPSGTGQCVCFSTNYDANTNCQSCISGKGGFDCSTDIFCGDGIFQTFSTLTEQCDDNNNNNGDGCSSTCQLEAGAVCNAALGSLTTCTIECGDGLQHSTEGCDDDDQTSGDGCDSNCSIEPGASCPINLGGLTVCTITCGDGRQHVPSEGCDDNNPTDNDGCTNCVVDAGATCTDNPNGQTPCTIQCGDSQRHITEGCDDGDTDSFDGCSSTCVIELGGGCPASPTLGALTVCTGPVCGDQQRHSTEGCDDGDQTSGDGCSSTCLIETSTGFTCTTVAGALSVCVQNCGNGIRGPTEACDLGSANNGQATSGCSAGCAVQPGASCTGSVGTLSVCTITCGDGVKHQSEGCDDNDTTGTDGCSATCTVEPGASCTAVDGTLSVCTITCGDGRRHSTENCDDGDVDNGDGCNSVCEVETNAGFTCVGAEGQQSVCADNSQCGDGIRTVTENCDLGTNNGGISGCTTSCTVQPGATCTGVVGQISSCSVTCGDGTKHQSEGCDDNDRDIGDGCDNNCLVELGATCTTVNGQLSGCSITCGDGRRHFSEICDDGDENDSNGCSNNCLVNTALGFSCTGALGAQSICTVTCGDGVKAASEGCDDGGTISGDGCSSVCTLELGGGCTNLVTGQTTTCTIVCGDGVKHTSEGCDDRNSAQVGCDGSCKVEPGATCTEDAAGLSTCTVLCGDGLRHSSEGCDDGGTTSGDGCSSTCTLEAGASCTTVLGQRSICSSECGDGVFAPDEGCDDGNLFNSDGCDSACVRETGAVCVQNGVLSVCTFSCGNGRRGGAEECDDGNPTDGDGCSQLCTIEVGATCTTVADQVSVCTISCGDGIKHSTEPCDDGNIFVNDGCTRVAAGTNGCTLANGCCVIEAGFSCTVTDQNISECRSTCPDGVKAADEGCDDNNSDRTDGCVDCTVQSGFFCTGAIGSLSSCTANVPSASQSQVSCTPTTRRVGRSVECTVRSRDTLGNALVISPTQLGVSVNGDVVDSIKGLNPGVAGASEFVFYYVPTDEATTTTPTINVIRTSDNAAINGSPITITITQVTPTGCNQILPTNGECRADTALNNGQCVCSDNTKQCLQNGACGQLIIAATQDGNALSFTSGAFQVDSQTANAVVITGTLAVGSTATEAVTITSGTQSGIQYNNLNIDSETLTLSGGQAHTVTGALDARVNTAVILNQDNTQLIFSSTGRGTWNSAVISSNAANTAFTNNGQQSVRPNSVLDIRVPFGQSAGASTTVQSGGSLLLSSMSDPVRGAFNLNDNSVLALPTLGATNPIEAVISGPATSSVRVSGLNVVSSGSIRAPVAAATCNPTAGQDDPTTATLQGPGQIATDLNADCVRIIVDMNNPNPTVVSGQLSLTQNSIVEFTNVGPGNPGTAGLQVGSLNIVTPPRILIATNNGNNNNYQRRLISYPINARTGVAFDSNRIQLNPSPPNSVTTNLVTSDSTGTVAINFATPGTANPASPVTVPTPPGIPLVTNNGSDDDDDDDSSALAGIVGGCIGGALLCLLLLAVAAAAMLGGKRRGGRYPKDRDLMAPQANTFVQHPNFTSPQGMQLPYNTPLYSPTPNANPQFYL